MELAAAFEFDSAVASERTITPSDFVTIGLLVVLEALLSADNAMVLAVLVLSLPKKEQRQALRYGMVGAFGFRILSLFTGLIGLALLAALVFWLFGLGRRRTLPAPEDDVESPMDEESLAEAERELKEDRGARPLQDGFEEGDTDDWGPGTR